jgi:hypothetical protein
MQHILVNLAATVSIAAHIALEDGQRKSVRVTEDPQSRSQMDIARWAHSVAVELGRL